jgi:phage recombination protein Bet
MAQPPAPIGIAPRYTKPSGFNGTDVAWRVLCDRYPAAETPEIILAVSEYCAVRRLDPLRNPVHIVPMWNSKLKRRVQTVMQGINEHEITAHRTGAFAGMDMPQWGPIEKRKFHGEFEDDQGNKSTIDVEIEFPQWCAVTVWRLVQGERRAFVEPVFWIEAYGRASFRSEVPNTRWRQAPRQMLHKCAKAAALRAAFPEEVGYAAEEMEDREVDAGGVTIDGSIDVERERHHGDQGGGGRRERLQAPGQGLARLEDTDSNRWYGALQDLLASAETLDEVNAIRQHHTVHKAFEKAPTLLRRSIEDQFKEAHERLAPSEPNDSTWVDPIGPLLAEVAAMDAMTIGRLPTDATWRKRVRDACAFPPDADRLDEAVEARRSELKRKETKP